MAMRNKKIKLPKNYEIGKEPTKENMKSMRIMVYEELRFAKRRLKEAEKIVKNYEDNYG